MGLLNGGVSRVRRKVTAMKDLNKAGQHVDGFAGMPAASSSYTPGKFANMPTPFRKGKDRIKLDDVTHRLQEMASHTTRLLEEAERITSRIMRETMKPDERFDLAETLFKGVYRATAGVYDLHIKSDLPAPMVKDRQLGLELSIQVFGHLGVIYKQIYQAYIEKALVINQKAKLSLCAFRLLETTNLLQLLLAQHA